MYYRVLLKREPDTTYNTARAQLGSIVETTVGIVVGCLPVIQPTISSRFAKIFHFFSFRSLISRISLRLGSFTGKATSSEKSPKEGINSLRISRPYLETAILHGADGEGNFMSSVETKKDPLRSWLSISRSRTILGTWTSGRRNSNYTTVRDTPHLNQPIMTTISASSHSHSDSSQGRDTDSHYTMQEEWLRNMI